MSPHSAPPRSDFQAASRPHPPCLRFGLVPQEFHNSGSEAGCRTLQIMLPVPDARLVEAKLCGHRLLRELETEPSGEQVIAQAGTRGGARTWRDLCRRDPPVTERQRGSCCGPTRRSYTARAVRCASSRASEWRRRSCRNHPSQRRVPQMPAFKKNKVGIRHLHRDHDREQAGIPCSRACLAARPPRPIAATRPAEYR